MKTKPKKRWSVSATLTVGVFTTVEADSAEKAVEIAMNRGVTSLCHGAESDEPSVAWCLCDGLGDAGAIEESSLEALEVPRG